MKNKVLFISHESELNGASRSLIEMLIELRSFIGIVVILPSKGIIERLLLELEFKYYIIPFSIDYGKIGSSSQRDKDNNFIHNYQAANMLAKIATDEDVNLIYSNSSVINVGAMVALMMSLPHVWHIRELLEEHFLSEFLDQELKKDLFKTTSKFITISKCVEQKYKEIYGISSYCIYDAVDFNRYYAPPLSRLEDDGLINIMIAGTISEEKGQLDAIRAVTRLIKSGLIKIRLYVVGSGARIYMWQLEQYIQSRDLGRYIKILPYQEDLRWLRSICCISLTCSKMEALGRTAIEAMMAGLIVIGSNTGGTLELIGKNEERGYLYPEGNVQELAATIKKVIDQPSETRRRKQSAAQEFAKGQFDSLRYARKMKETINQCIDSYTENEMRRAVRSNIGERFARVNNDSAKDQIQLPQQINSKSVMQIMDEWLKVKISGSSLASFLEHENLYRIAIYGMGLLGYHMFDELAVSDIQIVYVIDRAFREREEIFGNFELKGPEDNLEAVDAIIVTVVKGGEELKENLRKRHGCRILGIEEMIEFCLYRL